MMNALRNNEADNLRHGTATMPWHKTQMDATILAGGLSSRKLLLGLVPLAAAMALAFSGSALAAAQQDTTAAQQTSSSQGAAQDNSQANTATNGMSQKEKSAYREGEIWATYVVNPVLQAYKLDANVKGSTATLSGTVGTRYEKMLAETVAQTTSGIDTVTNNIKVNPHVVVVSFYVPASVYAQQVRNATTSARVNSLLLWNEYTDGSDIDVQTKNGKVTLTGVADTKKAKERATRIAANTQGVTSVSNQLTLGNPDTQEATDESVGDDSLKDRLQTSYLYAFHVNPADLKVNVNDGKATLTGDVASAFERQLVIDIAQHTRGVSAVDASGIDVADTGQMQANASSSGENNGD